jgi:protein-L-isoaspartate O-methyltransferase
MTMVTQALVARGIADPAVCGDSQRAGFRLRGHAAADRGVQLRSTDRLLKIGSGSGFAAAVFARVAERNLPDRATCSAGRARRRGARGGLNRGHSVDDRTR